MIAVYKYPLPCCAGPFFIRLPRDVELLGVQAQRGYPCLYARVNTDTALTDEWHFVATETGQQAPTVAEYIGTALLLDGAYVLHYFGGKP